MVRPDLTKWGQVLSDLRRLSVEADHLCSREPFLALYRIASGQTSATAWAAEIGRTKETVLKWVHQYNRTGPEGVMYRHTGGRAPLFRQSKPTSP
ncbi:MAG: hypothetical protein KatS3mg050_0504 [Litorilinea sp.]|nr:MAG: hypothetical protein KatS3mg050_0504 [Litorilinea sp.]